MNDRFIKHEAIGGVFTPDNGEKPYQYVDLPYGEKTGYYIFIHDNGAVEPFHIFKLGLYASGMGKSDFSWGSIIFRLQTYPNGQKYWRLNGYHLLKGRKILYTPAHHGFANVLPRLILDNIETLRYTNMNQITGYQWNYTHDLDTEQL